MQDDSVPGIEHLEEVATRPAGIVYRGVTTDTKRAVAVTVLDTTLSESQWNRFEHEFRAMRSIGGQPHVLTVQDAGLTAAGKPYVVTEYLTRTLSDFLGEKGTVRWQEAVALCVELASGLTAAHQVGVLHRDVSPENIFMASGDVPRLAGFGLARYAATGGGTDGGMPRYVHAAPELLQGKPVDERSDVYSLASVIFQTITGAPPFLTDDERDPAVIMERINSASPPSLASHDVPHDVEAVLDAALAKEPGLRPVSAALFAQQLLSAAKTSGESTAALARPAAAVALAGVAGGAAGAGDVGPGSATTPLERRHTRKPARRWPALLAFAAVAALVIGGLAWAVGRGDDDAGEAQASTTVASVTLSNTTTATTEALTATTAVRTTLATTAPTTVATTTTSTLPGGFQITGFSSEIGGAEFHIPANGDEKQFVYEVLVGKNEADFYCPVRTDIEHISGRGLAEIDLGGCFPPNDPPNEMTLQAFHEGTTTFKLWVCDGDSRGRTCPGTRSQNFILITVVVDPA